jgi:hypothetical protein
LRQKNLRSTLVASLALGLPGVLMTAPVPTTATPPGTLSAASFVEQWQAGPFIPDKGAPIAESSPMVATLDANGPSVVVGDRSGFLYALHLSNGAPVEGWPVNDGGTPIDSTPSVTALGGSTLNSVFVGEGDAHLARLGGYQAFGPSGASLWDTQVHEPRSDARPDYGVEASLTVADLQGGTGVFAGSLGQEAYALDASTGAPLEGWPFFNADTVFSTAAAADLYGNGQTELVVGGASTAGFAFGQSYTNGGHLRILNGRGGQICRYNTSQEVDSSPAIGGFLAGGATGIVVGTGSFYGGAAASNAVDAFGTDCNLMWSDSLDAFTESSPAIADVLGNGSLDIVQGTDNGASGSVWLIDGATGSIVWHQVLSGRVIGGAVTADLTGLGYQDVLVPTTRGVYVLDGRYGAVVALLGHNFGFQNSPLVTDDPDGTAGITIAGYNGANEGAVLHYEVQGSNGAEAVGAGSWPMFHHDPQLSGTTSGLPAAGSVPGCNMPAAANQGYDLASAKGAVFSYGQPFCGSPRPGQLNAPVVGMAMAPDVGGYWLATADGSVLNFGTARSFGSMAGKPLNSPIVALAATPDGGGYWLVAKDGGVFGFGDAKSLGSLAGKHLNAPIVGLATDMATGGYWLLASDGGVFGFHAPFKGAAGDLTLSGTIVGMVATADGGGYWLMSSRGGVYPFGDAPAVSSVGSQATAGRITGVTGYSG